MKNILWGGLCLLGLLFFSINIEGWADSVENSLDIEVESPTYYDVHDGPNPLLVSVQFRNISRENSFQENSILGRLQFSVIQELLEQRVMASYNGVVLQRVEAWSNSTGSIVSRISLGGPKYLDFSMFNLLNSDLYLVTLYGKIDFTSDIFKEISISDNGIITLNTLDWLDTENIFYNDEVTGEKISDQYHDITKVTSLITIEASLLKERHLTVDGEVLYEEESYVIPYQEYSFRPREFEGYKLIEEGVPSNSSGNITQPETQVDFYYEEIKQTGFEYEVSPQSVYLTQDSQRINPMNTVEDVRFNGKSLDPSEYEVKVKSFIDTDTVGRKTAEMEIIHKESGVSEQFDLPISVLWGNTILLQGSSYRSLGSYTYFPEEKYIQIGWGTEQNNSVIHSGWGDDIYYSTAFFRPNDDVNLIGTLSPFWEITGKGNQQAASLISDLPTRRIDVKSGDVMEIFHAQSISHPLMTQLFINEQSNTLAKIAETTYVEVTDNGYVPLQINYVIPKKSKIPINVSNEELEQSLDEFLDMSSAPQVQVVGFTEYPDRTKVGTTTGIIRVEQILSTGRSIVKDYEVPFTVELPDGLFGISTVDDILFEEVKQSSTQQLSSGKNQAGGIPRIQITDTSPAETWALRVSQPKAFSDASGNTLSGAYITLDNLSVSGDSDLLIADREIILGGEAEEIAWFFDHDDSNKKGITDIQFGKMDSGMQLVIPRNTIQNSTDYHATIQWELVSDPTLIKREEIK
ncbi:WxL domain-containing protein [Enterococcus casseliflavus]|uniref:WxL domain-containing protein n=1 Tax=Enterococcus casseliflavus TaxID=37734 RepID=UPI003DA57931